MNPLLSAALGAILRWGLAILAGFFVEHNIWTSAEATAYVAAAAVGILSLGLSLWNKYKGRIKFLTALAMTPGTTEAEVKEHIATGGATPPVSTPINMVPKITQ